ncbi:TauD/TfdA family dioxygenase, partial [Legionella pneumophila serogroup 2]
MNYQVTPITPFGVLLEPMNEQMKVTDVDIENLRHLFAKNQLVVLRGFDAFQNAEDFSDYCELWGEV